MCFYRNGKNYGDEEAMGKLDEEVKEWER